MESVITQAPRNVPASAAAPGSDRNGSNGSKILVAGADGNGGGGAYHQPVERFPLPPTVEREEHIAHDPRAPLPAPGLPPYNFVRVPSTTKSKKARRIKALLCCWGVRNPQHPRGRTVAYGGLWSGHPHAGSVEDQRAGGALSTTQMDQNGTYVPRPSEKLLLPPCRPVDVQKNCLIVDLDETLVHSSFKPVKNPDFIIPVEIDGVIHQVYVLKRPFVDEFLQRIADKFECILP